jgi:hypothetical protein
MRTQLTYTIGDRMFAPRSNPSPSTPVTLGNPGVAGLRECSSVSGKSPLRDLDLPELGDCPAPDKGVHRWTFYAAATLIPYVPVERDGELEEYIASLMTREPSPYSEVADSIRSARGAGERERQPRVSFNEYAARAFAASNPIENHEAYLLSRSPIDPRTVNLQGFLNALYREGEVVLLFNREESQGWSYTIGGEKELSEFESGEAGAWFLANPVCGNSLMNPRTGRRSRRSKENVTDFRYALIESDCMGEKDWTAILAQLPLRIVSVTHSGGKSLHAVIRVDAENESQYEEVRQKLRKCLVPLGACEASLSSVRLTRLPGVYRAGREQRLLFLNPEPDGSPIETMTERRAV